MLLEQTAKVVDGGKAQVIGNLLDILFPCFQKILGPEQLIVGDILGGGHPHHILHTPGEVAGADIELPTNVLGAQVFPVMSVHVMEKVRRRFLPAAQASVEGGRPLMVGPEKGQCAQKELHKDMLGQKIAPLGPGPGLGVDRHDTLAQLRGDHTRKIDLSLQVVNEPLLGMGRRNADVELKGFHRAIRSKVHIVQSIGREDHQVSRSYLMLQIRCGDLTASLGGKGDLNVAEQQASQPSDLALIPVAKERNIKVKGVQISRDSILFNTKVIQ